MPPNTNAPPPPARPGTLTRTLERSGKLIRWLLLSLLLSISLECLGMLFWWPEAGVVHSRNMLEAELTILGQDVPRSLLVDRPGAFAAWLAGRTRRMCLKLARLPSFPGIQARALPGTLSSVTAFFQHAGVILAPYGQAALNIVQVFSVRLAILVLGLPTFVLFGLVGLVDGLVCRDLRRWGGGRESSYLYHYAKKSMGRVFLGACVIYLALPFSLHPALILVPFAGLLAVGMALTASTFKKYL